MKKSKKTFDATTIIQKKRDGLKLTKEEISWFVEGVTDTSIPDYQTTALLMAIYLKGFDVKETEYLTDAMLYSGKVLDFRSISAIDKHSTGGVGDKTSFILAPIAAAAGVPVPMIAGRGLGHTGGTVDKIEAIKGFNTEVTLEKFSKQLKTKGLVLIGQTKEIAPADKKIYSLRDVTSTVESIPLITASIMSKKLAEGAAGIVMDIKTGRGAFMSELDDARALAKSLSNTAKRFGRSMITMITNMDEPLGNMIGNTHEIIESIEVLKNKGPKDITELSVKLAAAMIKLNGKARTMKEAEKKAWEVLRNGEALKKFKELIKIQGGDEKVVDDYSRMPQAKKKSVVKALRDGYVHAIDGKMVGMNIVSLGGGRQKATDKIDFGVGIELHKKVADKVKKGEAIATIFHHEKQKSIVMKIKKEMQEKSIIIKRNKTNKRYPLIIETKESKGK